MKVGILTPFDPLKILGGVEVFVITLKKELEKKGIKADIIHSTLPVPTGLQVLISLSLIRKIKKKSKECDIIHSNKWISWLNVFHDRPSVATTHDVIHGWLEAVGEFLPSYHRFYRKHITEWMEKKGYENTDVIAAISEKTKKEVVEGYGINPKKIKIVYNGVNIDRFKPRDKRRSLKNFDLPTDKSIVLTTGRMDIGHKGFDLLSEVSKNLRNPATMVVNGRINKKARKYVTPNMVENYIKTEEFEKKMPLIYNSADVFVQTSRYEGCSIALLEAVASGLPCVTFDVGAASGVIDDGKTGFIIPKFDTKLFSKKVDLLLSNPDLRKKMGKRAAKKRDDISISKMIDRYIKIYEKHL